MPASRDWVGVFWNGSKEEGPRGGKERSVGESNNGCFGNYHHPVLGFFPTALAAHRYSRASLPCHSIPLQA